MFSVAKICQSIKDLFTRNRNPFPQIPATLSICSGMKRPGLSAIVSAANLTRAMAKLGIPTGKMPDGSENLTIAIFLANFIETYRALNEDASIQGGTVGIDGKVVVGGNVGTIITNLRTFSIIH